MLSSTLTTADWNNTTAVTADEVAKLRESVDGNIAISGSATVVRRLLANGLLDELNLLVHPIAVGHGQRLFDGTPTHPLRLVRNATFTIGVLDLTYVPAT